MLTELIRSVSGGWAFPKPSGEPIYSYKWHLCNSYLRPHTGIACDKGLVLPSEVVVGWVAQPPEITLLVQLENTMKILIRSTLAATALALTAMIVSQAGVAQAPAGAPAGATGLCNDGSYWTGASKSGACRGHKGVKTWYASTGSAPAAPAAPAAAAPATPAPAAAAPAAMTPVPKTKTATTGGTATAPAPGGGPGLVWLNTSTKVYHCPGTKYYGTTKAGAYMTEAAAKANERLSLQKAAH